MSKNILRVVSFTLLAVLLVGCGAPTNSFAGTWISNVGKISITQSGNHITGVVEGYGNVHNESFTGSLISNNEAEFSTDWFGDFSLLVGSETFTSKSPELSFCGIRSNISDELPDGCGFSGTWLVPSKTVFPEGTTLVLKQIADKVSGDFLDKNGKAYETFSGFLYWGKGWQARGTTKQHGDLALFMNASETGFEFLYGNSGNKEKLCAVRAGHTSAYISYFTCEP